MVTGVQRENLCQHDMMTGVHRERAYDHDRVTGDPEQIGNCHDMTGIHEEVTYFSPTTSSGKQKMNRSTSQPQFRTENTPVTIEADQILLALQQLANNNNSANFHNNISRISKLPKSLTTTRPTFDGKLRNLSFLKTFSRRVSKFLTSWPKMTESIISILS